MQSPRISLIVPVHNAAGYLPMTFKSIQAQGLGKEMEVIYIDDGSTDGSGELALELLKQVDSGRFIRNDMPVGLADARNQGMGAAEGEYIAFLDGDDWMPPNQLATLLAAISSLDVDFVRTDHVQVTNCDRKLVRAPMARRHVALAPQADILPALCRTMVDYPYAWAGIYHRRLFESGLLRFPPRMFTAEDRFWIWRLHIESASYAVVDSPGVRYRRNVSSSLTQLNDRRQLDFLRAFAEIFAMIDSREELHRYWDKATVNFLAVLSHHLGRSDISSEVRGDLEAQAALLVREIPLRSVDFARTSWDQSRITQLVHLSIL